MLHAGVHLRITMEHKEEHIRALGKSLRTATSSDNISSDVLLVNVILEEELKAGHLICLREWLNGLFNHHRDHDDNNSNGSSSSEAVQAMLQIEHFSAEHVHLRAVAHPSNGDYGFQNHPAFRVFYRNGWYCQHWNNLLDEETTTDETDPVVDWLRQSWEMYVQPISPWSKNVAGDRPYFSILEAVDRGFCKRASLAFEVQDSWAISRAVEVRCYAL